MVVGQVTAENDVRTQQNSQLTQQNEVQIAFNFYCIHTCNHSACVCTNWMAVVLLLCVCLSVCVCVCVCACVRECVCAGMCFRACVYVHCSWVVIWDMWSASWTVFMKWILYVYTSLTVWYVCTHRFNYWKIVSSFKHMSVAPTPPRRTRKPEGISMTAGEYTVSVSV